MKQKRIHYPMMVNLNIQKVFEGDVKAQGTWQPP